MCTSKYRISTKTLRCLEWQPEQKNKILDKTIQSIIKSEYQGNYLGILLAITLLTYFQKHIRTRMELLGRNFGFGTTTTLLIKLDSR